MHSVLQCVAVCRIVLQQVAVYYCSVSVPIHYRVARNDALQCVAVRCTVCQCVAVWCSVWQCIGSVWQCVAESGSVWQLVAVYVMCCSACCSALQCDAVCGNV